MGRLYPSSHTYIHRLTNHFMPAEAYGLRIVEYLTRPFAAIAICLAVYWLMQRFTPRLLAILTGRRDRGYAPSTP